MSGALARAAGADRAPHGEVLLGGWVAPPGAASLTGLLLALAIIPLVAVAVNLLVGVDRLPRGLEKSTPWFVGAAVLFGGLTYVHHRRTRKRLELTRRPDGGLVLRINEDLQITEPVELLFGWEQQQQVGNAPATRLLMAGIVKEGVGQVVISEEWGIIHGVPEGWPERLPALPRGPLTPEFKVSGLSKLLPELVQKYSSARSPPEPR